MSLPAELRLNIYEYVFCDNEPDEVPVVDDTPDIPEDGTLATNERAPEEIAAQGKSSTKKKQPRQINLLDAKKHYPDPALLATCKFVLQEAKPTFEVATNVFWDIDIFNLTIASRRPGPLTHYFTLYPWISAQILAMRTQLESMSLLKQHGIKELRFSWTKQCIAVKEDADEELVSLRLGDGSRPDVDDHVVSEAQVLMESVTMHPEWAIEIAGEYPRSTSLLSASRMLGFIFKLC